ncbi:hypothetical protein [Citromicrobium bathyomarinum]|uniref:hypothetical protein n=1 Tax=Citromicrobium bathyomarinum TaxID=72174 RepID=UPI003159FCDB
MRLPLLALFATLAVAGCSSEPDPDGADGTADDTSASHTASPAAQATGVEDTPDGESSSGKGYTSSYTKLDLDKCRVLDKSTGEGSWIEFRCPGLQDIPLFVSEGDGRFDVDAGIKNGDFATISAFNEIGDTIEWRLRDGKPFAVIFRYRDVSMESAPRSVLAVETIGSDGVPGCRVAQIDGSTSSANQRAREIADSEAIGFDCGKEPQYIGDAR